MRRRQKRSQEGEGRAEQTERRAQSASGPSAGRHVGTAESLSGRARAWRPSASSPDSWKRETQKEQHERASRYHRHPNHTGCPHELLTDLQNLINLVNFSVFHETKGFDSCECCQFTSGILCSHIHRGPLSGKGGCLEQDGGSSSGTGGRSWVEGRLPTHPPLSPTSTRCDGLSACLCV